MKKGVVILCLSLLLTGCGTERIANDMETDLFPAQTADNWKDAYKEVLYDFMQSDLYSETFSAFSLYDLTGDDVPELILSEDTTHAAQCELYTFDGSLISLGQWGSYGRMGYCPEKNTIVISDIAQGYIIDIFGRIEENSIVKLITLSNDSGMADTEEITYTIDDTVVTKEAYDDAMQEHSGEEYVTLGQDYTFDEIESALAEWDETSAISPAQTADNWQDAYKEVLYDFMQTDLYSETFSAFSLYDLTGDNVPELILFHCNGDCTMYTYDAGLVSLGTIGANDGLGYYRDNHTLVANSRGQGYHFQMFYTLENNTLTMRAKFFDNETWVENPDDAVYQIDDTDVSKAAYEAAVQEQCGEEYMALVGNYTYDEIESALAEW